MKRVLDVARIQLMSWTAVLAYPLGVVASLVVLGLAIDVANGDGAFSERPIILLPTAALLAGIGVLVTSQGWWPAVGDFFTRPADPGDLRRLPAGDRPDPRRHRLACDPPRDAVTATAGRTRPGRPRAAWPHPGSR